MALSDVRRRYDSLMERAAAAPGSTLGQQLYTVRVQAKLSAQEAANGVGLPPGLPDELEAGATPTEQEAAKIHELIAAIRQVADLDGFELPQAAEAHVNGWDESLATNGAGQEVDAAH
jgi:hypothetical protein